MLFDFMSSVNSYQYLEQSSQDNQTNDFNNAYSYLYNNDIDLFWFGYEVIVGAPKKPKESVAEALPEFFGNNLSAFSSVTVYIQTCVSTVHDGMPFLLGPMHFEDNLEFGCPCAVFMFYGAKFWMATNLS